MDGSAKPTPWRGAATRCSVVRADQPSLHAEVWLRDDFPWSRGVGAAPLIDTHTGRRGWHWRCSYRGIMTANRRALVVAPHADVANTVVSWLTSQGYHASLVTDYASARPEIDANPPDLLVTEVKLGEFNGLHLAMRAHQRSPGISTIVIGDDDIVLERDAVAQHATYVRRPELSTVFPETGCELLH